MKTLKEMYHARIAWNQQDNIDSTIGEMRLSSSDLKKAQKIINDPKTKGGNYGQAVKDLEKWKKGSTKDKRVADMLYKAHNEAKVKEQIHGHDDDLEKKSKFKKEETEVVVEGKGTDIFIKYNKVFSRMSDKDQGEMLDALYSMNTEKGARYKDAWSKVKELLNL